MAKITVALCGILHIKDAESREVSEEYITLATDKKSCDVLLVVDEKRAEFASFSMSILDFSFQKKMYQPTEFNVVLSIAASQGTTYQDIPRNQLDQTFKHLRVEIGDADSDFYEGKEFYVHEVLPVYTKNAEMQVTLKIFSLDKLLTLKEASRTFVAKKLHEDILSKEIKKYIKPWTVVNTDKIDDAITKRQKKLSDNNDLIQAHKVDERTNETELSLTEIADITKEITQLVELKRVTQQPEIPMTYTAANMRMLKYKRGNNYHEHIFPYLVQYNESFYDFLARTTNRWGEFMFFENDQLNFGYDASREPVQVAKKDIVNISYGDLNSRKLRLATDGAYYYEADNSSLTGKPLQKSPVIVKAQMGDFGGKEDKWIMKQFANIFKNDKNLPTMITNLLFDNLFNLAMAESSVAKRNSDFNDKYFANYDTNNVQYGQHNFAKKGQKTKMLDGFQQFTELHTDYDGKKYKSTLEKEQTTGENAIYINYGTTYPKLKLGNIITFNKENFIVVEVTSNFDANRNLVFQVVATAQDKDKLFYPAVIPAGHVRYANPQPATITDPKDPTLKNRVRVMFDWQTIKYEDDDNTKPITEETKALSTPWLNFASNQDGAPIMGYHYEKNPVMVGFEGGNVERPYIMGGLADDFLLADKVLTSQGMHQLTLSDGLGNGMTAFLAGCFSPLLKTIMGFAPGLIPSWKWDKSKYFEGGFELTDYYGIYKISGSTDGRNVTVDSPWGDVKVNAFTGINISAPNGDVKISGKNVTIEAGNNLKLVSGTNVDYKLWKSKDTKKGTAAQILLDVTAQVTKKLAQIALSVVDLSLVRSTVEIFFRPVEGCLTVKSNRFLKLESGKANCDYPEIAYNKEKKLKVLNEANKKAITKDAKVGPGLIDVFKKIPVNTNKMIEKFIEEYNSSVEQIKIIDAAITELKQWANGDQAYVDDENQKPCKTYEELKDDLWNQEKDEDWKDDKLGFKDEVKIDGTYDKCIDLSVTDRLYPFGIADDENMEWVGKRIFASRKKGRQTILKEVNKLRKKIYYLSHVEPDKIAVNEMFHSMIVEPMPKDYKKKLVTAFSKDKCQQFRLYNITDQDKKLEKELDEVFGVEKVYMMRLVTMNLLEEFGFKDDTRMKLGADPSAIPPKQGELPPKPKADTKDPTQTDNILNDECWSKYIQSLNALPKIGFDITTVGGAIAGAIEGEMNAALDKLKFWKGAAERGTWGNGMDGQILFGSGRDTYYLAGEKIEKMNSKLKPTLTSMSAESMGNQDKQILTYWMAELKKNLNDL